MEHANKRLTQTEEALLKRAKGARLFPIDAVLVAPPDNAWNTVRLHFDEFDIDVNNSLNDIVIDEFGTLEEFGLLSITEAVPDILDIPEAGADAAVFRVDQTIRSVRVINDIADIYGEGSMVARLEYPQAIAFGAGQNIIMLDKEVWFSEMIAIKQGSAISDLLYDDSVNWEDDPEEDSTTHFEFRTETEAL